MKNKLKAPSQKNSRSGRVIKTGQNLKQLEGAKALKQFYTPNFSLFLNFHLCNFNSSITYFNFFMFVVVNLFILRGIKRLKNEPFSSITNSFKLN